MWSSSSEAEKSLIACVMLDSEASAYACSRMVPGDFADDLNAEIFRRALALYNAGRPVDLVTLSQEPTTSGGPEFPVEVTMRLTEASRFLPSTANFKTYADIVLEKSSRRKLYLAAKATMDAVQDEARDITQTQGRAVDAMLGANRVKDDGEQTDAASVLLATVRYAQERDGAGDANLTGVADIDRVMGGLHPGELTILAAQTGNGKSVLGWQIAEKFAERGQRVEFISNEMSQEQIGARWMARLGVSTSRMRSGTMTEADWEGVNKALKLFSGYPVNMHTTITRPSEIRTLVQDRMRTGGLGLVVVDYMQLLTPNRGSTPNRVADITQISRDLKLITTEFRVPLLVLSQLSRSPEKRATRMPILSDLRDSGAIEQDADNVLFLMKPKKAEDAMACDREEYEQIRRDGNELTYCTLSKHRNGPLMECKLLFSPKTVSLYSMTYDFTPVEDAQTEWEGETA